VLFVSCAPGAFLGGSQGGQVCPPWLRAAGPPKFFFGRFLLFLADFAIFSGLLKIIPVLGIRVLVSTEVDVALHWGEPRISCVLMCFVRCCLCVYLLSVVVIMYDEWI
jgi:hypothetical protein